MQPPTFLVISDPPHGAVMEEAAATIMGLPAAEVRLKMAFGAPEVLAATNADRAADIAESLIAAGVNVGVRGAGELAQVPWPSLATSFEFMSDRLELLTGEGTVAIPYDEPAFAVACRPPGGFQPPRRQGEAAAVGRKVSEVVEWIPHVDLYFVHEGALSRASIAPELAGSHAGRSGGNGSVDLTALIDECRARFGRLDVDARLDGVRPRRRFVAGEAGFDPDVRKRYAFGTLLLRHLLESISPDLRDVTHYELGSRMAYVLRPARGRVRLG